MKSDFDWLEAGDIDFSGPVKESKVAIANKDPGKAIIRKRNKRPAELVLVERKLTPPQRFYARMVVETETYAAAERRMLDAGYKFNRVTLYRWRQMPHLISAVHLGQNYLFERLGISKERIMSDAEKIKQIALTPQPILYKGKTTGYEEVQLSPALRALELMGKGVGLNEGERQRVQVNIDIDFSGRVDGVDVDTDTKANIIEGEFEYVDK